MPRKSREEYNAYMKVYMLRRYHARRRDAILRLGGCCVTCGTTENLEFDHVDKTTKRFTIGKTSGWSDARFWTEITKCQLLCKPCHYKKSLEAGDFKKGWRHGSHAAWNIHMCRCDLCTTSHLRHLEDRRNRYSIR